MTLYAIPDRGLIAVTGQDAEHFLQNLITADLSALAEAEVRPTALLTPQGKIAYPFLISRMEDGFRLEIEANRADEFSARLNLYRMRAKLTVTLLDETAVAMAVDTGKGLIDSRFPPEADIRRLYGDAAAGAQSDPDAVAALRITHCVPEPDTDYAVGDAFAFDALLDQLGGLSVRKGCFVGQEVISRMHHRGTARRRVVRISSEEDLPEPGTNIEAAGKPVGSLGTVAGKEALAMVRLDRVANAIAQGVPLVAGDVNIKVQVPERFSFALSDYSSSTDDDS